MSGAFGGSGAFSSSGGGGSPYPSAPRSSGGLTLRELLMLQLAQQNAAKRNTGFLHEVEHGGGKLVGSAGHLLGNVFHQIERPFHGIEQGLYQAQQGAGDAKPGNPWDTSGFTNVFKNFGKGFDKGFSTGTSKSGADLAGQFSSYTPVGKAIDFNKHHFAAGVAGFGLDVAADPLSFVGFGVKGTSETLAARRMLLNPKNFWQINQASSDIKKALAAGANPQLWRARKALNLMDRQLYKTAKATAATNGEQFMNKDGQWLGHLFDPKLAPGAQDVLAERSNLADMAFHEAMTNDARFKSLDLSGHTVLQWGKNVATKTHSSALSKLFSNVSRYGVYYPLSLIGTHAGVRSDIVQRMYEEGIAKGVDPKVLSKKIQDFISAHEMTQVKNVLARMEGTPTTVIDHALHRGLKSEGASIAKLHDVHGVPFNQIGFDHPGVLKRFGLEATKIGEENIPKMTDGVTKIYHAHHANALREMARVENPAVKDMVPLSGKAYKGISVSKGAKSFLEEYKRQFLTDENLHPFVQKIMHGRGILKRGYTGANPFGYAIRNTLTDVWNAALTHTPVVRGMARYAVPAKRLISSYDGITKKLVAGEALTMAEKQTYMQVHHMHSMGILSGLFAKDVQDDKALMNQLHPERGFKILKKTKGRRFLHAYATGAVKFNETRENVGRMAHYLYRTKHLGQSPQEAALMVKRAHFDYQDITPFEQRYMKSLFPFYTWYRKNLPFQVSMLTKKPGQFMRYVHLQQESAQASGDKKDVSLPDYLGDSPTTIRLPFGKNLYANPATGQQDLQGLEHPINEFFQKIGPPANLALAYASGKDNFSGTQLTGANRLTPTNPLLGKALSYIPGMTGQTQRQIGGKEVQARGITPWTNFLLGQIPGASMALGANPVSTGRRGLPTFDMPGGAGPFPTGPALSYFGGQSVYGIDPAQQQAFEQAQITKQVTNQLQKLYDSGILKPGPKRRQSRFDRLFAKASGG